MFFFGSGKKIVEKSGFLGQNFRKEVKILVKRSKLVNILVICAKMLAKRSKFVKILVVRSK